MSYIEIPVAEYRRRLAALSAPRPEDAPGPAPVRTASAAYGSGDGAA